MPDIPESVKKLVAAARKRGWLSYEELNNALPDEMVDADRLHDFLVVLDESGVELVDEMEYKARCWRESGVKKGVEGSRGQGVKAASGTPEPPTSEACSPPTVAPGPGDSCMGDRKGRALSVPGGERTNDARWTRMNWKVRLTEERLVGVEHLLDDAEADELRTELARSAAIDLDGSVEDPIRVYLSQMATIPLLAREEEIRLAKKVETTRMIFRRRCLECDCIVAQAVVTLRQVEQSELPFDRTMRVSTLETDAKDRIMRRMPGNLDTVERLLAMNKADWALVQGGQGRHGDVRSRLTMSLALVLDR